MKVLRFARDLCLGALSAAMSLAQEPAAAPSPADAVSRLQKGFADKDPGPALAAVDACGRIQDDEVVKQLAKGLAHKEPLVQRAVLQALRHNPQPSAFTALLAAATKEKLLADDKVAADYYLALGQKGDAKALPVLSADLHITRGSEVVSARILAIGRIRVPQSVDRLMQLMKSGGGGGSRGGGSNPHMKDLRLALAALTGEDFNDTTSWIRWWSKQNDGYKVPAKEASLPKNLAGEWEATWRDPQTAPKKQGREDKSSETARGGG